MALWGQYLTARQLCRHRPWSGAGRGADLSLIKNLSPACSFAVLRHRGHGPLLVQPRRPCFLPDCPLVPGSQPRLAFNLCSTPGLSTPALTHQLASAFPRHFPVQLLIVGGWGGGSSEGARHQEPPLKVHMRWINFLGLPNQWWLPITEHHQLTILEARSPKSKCRQGWCPVRTMRESPFPASLQLLVSTVLGW